MSGTTFIETQFPTDISYGSKGGSGFNTSIFETTSGYEQRNINWSMSRARWDISYGIKTLDQMTNVVDMFMAVNGKAVGFRFKDWGDFQIANQQIGIGDGSTLAFQLVKVYADPNNLLTFTRTIVKPVPGSLQAILVNGAPIASSNYNLNTITGVLTFATYTTGPHTDISFINGSPSTINAVGGYFVTDNFGGTTTVTVTGSASNNGTYKVQSVSAGTLTLASGVTLVNESAGSSVTLVDSFAPYNTYPVLVTYVEFDVPARFDTDELNLSQDFFEVESWDSIPVIEIRLPSGYQDIA